MMQFRPSTTSGFDATAVAVGQLLLRVGAGAMILYLHGWHKFEGWFEHCRHGTTWKLAKEVADMHFPVPLVSAFAATSIQLICSFLLALGLFTRINASLLVAVLGVAILQNLLTSQNAELVILYTLIVIVLAVMGGGTFSLDRWLEHRKLRPLHKDL